jgi:hypothetical protein
VKRLTPLLQRTNDRTSLGYIIPLSSQNRNSAHYVINRLCHTPERARWLCPGGGSVANAPAKLRKKLGGTSAQTAKTATRNAKAVLQSIARLQLHDLLAEACTPAGLPI